MSRYIIKHHTMKACVGVQGELHALLTLEAVRGKFLNNIFMRKEDKNKISLSAEIVTKKMIQQS